MARRRALLLDVGGTIVPDNLPPSEEITRTRLERLRAALPTLDAERVVRLRDELWADAAEVRHGLEQRTDAAIEARLAAIDPALVGRAPAVRRAVSGTWAGRVETFAGHRDLVLAARDLGLRRVIVSNTNFDGAEDWPETIGPALGLDGLLDGVVTSYDVGWRKPHRAMFERALEIAGHAAVECVMIGNDERKDVEPAKELGMYVIRVAIQEPPTPTRADRLVTSLGAAREALTNA